MCWVVKSFGWNESFPLISFWAGVFHSESADTVPNDEPSALTPSRAAGRNRRVYLPVRVLLPQ